MSPLEILNDLQSQIECFMIFCMILSLEKILKQSYNMEYNEPLNIF